MAKTSCQKASKGMYSGSQCHASSVLQSAKLQRRTALSVMQPERHTSELERGTGYLPRASDLAKTS